LVFRNFNITSDRTLEATADFISGDVGKFQFSGKRSYLGGDRRFIAIPT
jgi:hypothetical protein